MLRVSFWQTGDPVFFRKYYNEEPTVGEKVKKVKRAEILEAVHAEWIQGSMRVEQLLTEMHSGCVSHRVTNG